MHRDVNGPALFDNGRHGRFNPPDDLATACGTLAALCDGDRAFLLAMAEDDGPSRMRDIAARLGQSDAYTSQYRLPLIDADVIHPVARGYVEYTVPYVDDFIRREVGRDHRLVLGEAAEIEPPRRGITAPPGLDID